MGLRNILDTFKGMTLIEIVVLVVIVIFVVLNLASCTDAQFGKFTALGDSARVTCHSGGKIIFDGCSTGKVKSEQNSDGYHFKEKVSGRFVEVSGECIIDYEAPCPRELVVSRTP